MITDDYDLSDVIIQATYKGMLSESTPWLSLEMTLLFYIRSHGHLYCLYTFQ